MHETFLKYRLFLTHAKIHRLLFVSFVHIVTEVNLTVRFQLHPSSQDK